MDSVEIELSKLQIRKIAQDVLIFVWHKQEVISEKPDSTTPLGSEIIEFMNNLRLLVWIESSRNEYVWGDFLENHFKRMTKTPYLFANYVAYASYLFIDKTADVHVCFFDILSLVTHFALHCWQNDYKKFLNTCVDLFCAFFEKELLTAFKHQGRWKNFNEYLANQEIMIRYKELQAAKKPPYELFKELQSVYLNSNTPSTINDVVLKDITRSQVENDKKAVSFADSVGAKMKEVYEKPFNEILKDFSRLDIQLKALYLEMLGVPSDGIASDGDQSSSQEVLLEKLREASGGIAGDGDQSSSQEARLEKLGEASGGIAGDGRAFSPQEIKALENISSDIDSNNQIKGIASNALETGDTGSLIPQELDQSPKLVKLEREKVDRAKKLLNEMMEDIAKISELIKFVCEENSVKVVNTDKKSDTANP